MVYLKYVIALYLFYSIHFFFSPDSYLLYEALVHHQQHRLVSGVMFDNQIEMTMDGCFGRGENQGNELTNLLFRFFLALAIV